MDGRKLDRLLLFTVDLAFSLFVIVDLLMGTVSCLSIRGDSVSFEWSDINGSALFVSGPLYLIE